MDENTIRVSDGEREATGHRLQAAVSEGRISIAEFTERMDVAMAARTRGELAEVVGDLPDDTETDHGTGNGPSLVKRPGAVFAPVHLRSVLGTTTRKGSWTVPAEITIRNVLGTLTLDLTAAELSSPDVSVALDDWLGTTTIIVPPGTVVDLGAVRSTMATVTDNAHSGGHATRLRLTVTGVLRMSTLTVRQSYGETVRRFLA